MQSDSAFNVAALNDSWLNFYALFDLAPDAPEAMVRKRLSTLYSEAIANYNHRDRARRDYCQILGQQTIPQGRRVLLDPHFRQAYDHQNALHQAGDPDALDYKTFLTTLHEAAAVYGDDTSAPAVAAASAVPSADASVEPEPVAADKPFLAPIPLNRPLSVTPGADATLIPTRQKTSLRPAAPTGPTSFIQDNLSSPRATQKALRAAQQSKQRQKSKFNPSVYAPRLSVSSRDETATAPSNALFRPGERALSDTSIALMTAIVATMLSITIDYFSMPGMTAWAGSGFAFTQLPSLRQCITEAEPDR